MALKILLADDSMTAQNMGKKILVDAGYEVVAVSNGAAALKKIAELKPDIAVLDIYMPGYTGLEVCERVKSSPMTVKMPVLLTVGKMEPYRPEDGSKVNADGVIIKPFEASDLIAAVGKLAEMVASKQASVAPKYEAEAEDSEDLSYQQGSEVENASNDPAAASALAAMMSAPAMMDEFSVDFPVHADVPAFEAARPLGFPGFSVETSHAAAFEAPLAEAPAYGFEDAHPVATMTEEATQFAVAEVQAAEHHAEVAQHEDVAAESEFAMQAEDAPAFAIDPEPFPQTSSFDLTVAENANSFELESTAPAVDEPSLVEVALSEELERTSAPQVGEIEVVQENALESPVEEEVVISAAPDPALAISPEDFSEFATHVGELNPEPMPVGIFSGLEEMSAEPQPAVECAEADAEFVPVPMEDTNAEDVFVAELPQSAEEPAAAGEPAPAEESVANDERYYFAAPAVSDEPVVADIPFVLREPVAESAPELDLMAEPSEVSDFEAADIEPKSWTAEETTVLPAESMSLLEEEMRQSLTEAVPVPEPLKDPLEDDILGSAFEESPEAEAELTDAATEPLIAVPEASSVTSDYDREFAARLAAALNEIQSEELLNTPEGLLPEVAAETCDTTVANGEETTVGDVEINSTAEILEAEDPLVEEAPQAMAATASISSAQPASSDALRIADVVHRVFERYKEQMAAEIAQELSKEK